MFGLSGKYLSSFSSCLWLGLVFNFTGMNQLFLFRCELSWVNHLDAGLGWWQWQLREWYRCRQDSTDSSSCLNAKWSKNSFINFFTRPGKWENGHTGKILEKSGDKMEPCDCTACDMRSRLTNTNELSAWHWILMSYMFILLVNVKDNVSEKKSRNGQFQFQDPAGLSVHSQFWFMDNGEGKKDRNLWTLIWHNTGTFQAKFFRIEWISN